MAAWLSTVMIRRFDRTELASADSCPPVLSIGYKGVMVSFRVASVRSIRRPGKGEPGQASLKLLDCLTGLKQRGCLTGLECLECLGCLAVHSHYPSLGLNRTSVHRLSLPSVALTMPAALVPYTKA
jgi:hypothetical protein